MNSTIQPSDTSASGGSVALPGQAQDVTVEDLDDVQLMSNTIRTPAALQPTMLSLSLPSGAPPGLRKAAGGIAEPKPIPATSLHSVVTRVSALSHVAGQQKKRLSTGLWVAEVVLFLCFICILSALLIEGRDTTSIFQYRSFLVNLISTSPFTSTAAAATATFSTITKCTDALDFASEVLLPLTYSNASNPSSLLSQGITLVWPLQLVNKLVARSSSCPSVDGSSTTSCYPSWDNYASAETKNSPIASWPSSASFSQYHASMEHEDTTGIRSALSKAYGNGGFKLSLTGSYNAALSSIRQAAQSQWISQQHTRAVFMTFGLFVPSTNYFFVATLLVECFSTDSIYFIVEIIMYCLALVLFFFELYKFYFLRSRHYMKFRAWIAVVNFLSVALSAFFSWKAWSEALRFAALGGDITKTADYNLQGLAFDRMLVQCSTPPPPSKSEAACQCLLIMLIRYLNSLTAVLTWSRLTLYLGDAMPRAKELANTLATAFLDMQYLLLILLLVFFGFALGFQQAFGDFIVHFSSLYSTCFHLFKALTGDMEGMSEIPKNNRYLGPVLYFAFLVIIFFVLLNMVLGVVVRSYEKIDRRLREKAASAISLRARLNQGLTELKNAMFTRTQMQQIESVSAAISGSGDAVMSRLELQQLYDQHAATFAMLELPDMKSLLHLAGLSSDADKVDTSLITEALSRHTQLLKDRRREAVVKAESEVLKMSGDLNANADATGQAASSVDNSQLLAAVEASIARSEQRMQAFVRDELRRAIITITKLDVPSEAPPPPQFSAQQFRRQSVFDDS